MKKWYYCKHNFDYYSLSITRKSQNVQRKMWVSFQKEAGSAGETCAPRRTRVRLVVHPGRSYYFSIKWLTPFYPANPSQAAGGGEKCMDLRFLRLRRWLLKQQPNKTVFNRFIEN